MRFRSRLVTAIALVLALNAAGVPAARSSEPPAWEWPVDSATVERPFDAPEHPYGPGHRGVDLQPRLGTGRIVAPADGTVAFVGRVVDRDVLTIDHGNGLVSSFEPAMTDHAVGTAVRRGQPIGSLAVGGHTAPGRLHFGVRRDGVYIDPLTLLRERRRAVLLPCC